VFFRDIEEAKARAQNGVFIFAGSVSEICFEKGLVYLSTVFTPC